MTGRNDRRTNDDAQAQFLRLFLSSERELFRYVTALVPNVGDAEEIVQQTAVELWKKFDQYDPQQPFAPWACRFAINIVKQWVASRLRSWNARKTIFGRLLSACAGRNDKIWDQKRVTRSRNGRQSLLSCPPAAPSPLPLSAAEIPFSSSFFLADLGRLC